MLLSMALLLTMACFASCSKDDDIVSPERPETTDNKPISFSSSMLEGQAVTRASGLEDIQTSFTVYGYKNDAFDNGTNSYTSYQTVFPGFVVNWTVNSAYTTTSNTSDWEYVGITSDQTIKYWDFGANAYRFFGYALGKATDDPATSIVPVTANTSSSPVTLSATVDASTDATVAAAPYFTRLWFSTGNSTVYPNKLFGQPVILEFLKPFARVRFRFMFIDGLTFGREALSKIKFWPTVNADGDPANDRIIANAGTVSVHYPLKGTGTKETWTTSGTTGIQAFTIDWYETTETPDPTQPEVYPNSPEHWYYVLPTSSQGSYTLEVAVVSDEVKTAVVPAEFMTWKPGFEYTYNFKINESGGIVIDIVQVAINDWGNRKSAGHSVYNW